MVPVPASSGSPSSELNRISCELESSSRLAAGTGASTVGLLFAVRSQGAGTGAKGQGWVIRELLLDEPKLGTGRVSCRRNFSRCWVNRRAKCRLRGLQSPRCRHAPAALLQDMEEERDRSRKKEAELVGRHLPAVSQAIHTESLERALRCCPLTPLAEDMPGSRKRHVP